jgi:hypothetical protein
LRLGVDQQQEDWHLDVVVEVDDPCAAPFAHALATPTDLPYPAGILDDIAGFRIASDEIHEGLAFAVIPHIPRQPLKKRQFDHAYGRL